MATRKVTLKEFKEIVKNIIKEETTKEIKSVATLDTTKQAAINMLTDKYKYPKKDATKKVSDNMSLLKSVFEKHKDDKKSSVFIASKFVAKIEKK